MAQVENGKLHTHAIVEESGRVFDCILSREGRPTILFTTLGPRKHRLWISRQSEAGWQHREVLFDDARRLPIETARLAPDANERVQGLCLRGSEHIHPYRMIPSAEGWQSLAAPEALKDLTPEGRFGLAFSELGHLTVAYMDASDSSLRILDLDSDLPQAIEPQPGCTLRWPQVDLAYDASGRAHCIYFQLTPDGGLQIRLAREISGGWSSMMIDRTMSKNSLASCSMALQHGRDPFLAYALGPARAVLLAYPKEAAPPGTGLCRRGD
jgi:hypothetical protein